MGGSRVTGQRLAFNHFISARELKLFRHTWSIFNIFQCNVWLWLLAWAHCSVPDWGNVTLTWQSQYFKVRNVTPVECQFDTVFFFFFQIAQDTVTQTRNKSGLQWSDFKAAVSSSWSDAGCSFACGKESKDGFTPTTVHVVAIKWNDNWKSLLKLVGRLYGCFWGFLCFNHDV